LAVSWLKGKLIVAMLDGLLVSSRQKMCRVVVLLALAGIGVFSGNARALPNYFMRQWQNEDGLPQNGVTALVQTHEGYIWVGTYSGLARFDGVQFELFDSAKWPELHSSRITSLFEDEAGQLWIGHETGDLTLYRSHRFEAMDLGPGWNGRKILALGSDARGDVWALGSDGALVRVRDQKILPPAGADAGSVALARDREGTLWVLRDRALWRLDSDNLEPVRLGTNSANPYVQGICASKDGGVWVVVDGQVRKWRNNSWPENLGPAPWGFGSAVAFTETRAGDLAAGIVDGGLNLLFKGGGSMCFTRTNGLPSDWVRALFEDREGDLWVGTGNGLVALRDGKVATLNPPDQWQGRAILSVSPAREGGLWIGTEGAGVYRYNAGRWTRYGAEEGLPNMFVWSVSEDPQDRLWAGTWGGGLVMQRSNRFEHVAGLEGLTVPILAVLHTERGAWLGTGSGLAYYEDGETTWYGAVQGLSLPDVRAVVKDARGAVWFGMVGGGLGCLENGKVRQYRKADGLSSDFIQCLRGEADGSLWIGTSGGGLNRFKNGKFSVVDTDRGLRNNIICDIQDDQRGCYWLSSHGGILRIKKEQLNECADGKIPAVECQAFDRGDGMPTLECTGGFQPAGCRTDDGRLWFPTSKGLVG
jgi:ligand-binding sensor domain-containing protein